MEENKKQIKVISTILRVVAILIRIGVYIGLFALLIGAILVPKFFKQVDMKKDYIKIKDVTIANKKDTIVLTRKDDKINAYYSEKDHDLNKELDETETIVVNQIFDMLNDSSKGRILAFIELVCIFGIACLVLFNEALKRVEKTLKNLKEKDEVFSNDNAKLLRKSAVLFGVLFVVSAVCDLSLALIFDFDLRFGVSTMGVVEILIVFLIAYIFDYGSKLNVVKETTEPVKKVTTKKPRTSKKKEEK